MPGAKRWAFSCNKKEPTGYVLALQELRRASSPKNESKLSFSSSSYDVRTCGSYPCLEKSQ
jgi:hypothetical protein